MSFADVKSQLFPDVLVYMHTAASIVDARKATSTTEVVGSFGYTQVFLDECCFTSTKTVGFLGTGAQDGHLDFHTAHEFSVALRPQKP